MGDSIACPASSSKVAPADADERDAEGEFEHMEPEVLLEFSFKLRTTMLLSTHASLRLSHLVLHH
eukprot:1636149-Amphidinium_carterae.3